MKSVLIPAILAAGLAVAGATCWMIGRTEMRLGAAHRQLAMLRYSDAAALSDGADAPGILGRWLGGLRRDAVRDAREVRATADYWRAAATLSVDARETVEAGAGTDAGLALIDANAAFRASQAIPDRENAVRKLDLVLSSYANILRLEPTNTDVAFNYEYSVRTRDKLVRGRQATVAKTLTPLTQNPGNDLPSGPTLHGRPGAPPVNVNMAQFKIVIPKQSEERTDENADKGRPVRQG